MISAAVGPGGETMISGADHRGLLECGRHVKPLVHRPELLARAGPDAPAPRRTRREVPTPSSPAIRTPGCPTRSRPPASIYLPADMERLHGRVRRQRPAQHRRRLLRQHAGAHRRHRQSRRAATRRACCPSSPRSRPMRLTGSAAVQPQRGIELPDDRRAHQRRRLAEVRQARQGRQTRRSRRGRPPAGRERRQRHRHLLRRRPDRRQGDDDAASCTCSRASRTSRRCRSWSIPRSGRSSRPA